MAKRNSPTSKRKTTIGWREWVALPDLRVKQIKVKVDTGARSSSLHADDIRMTKGRQGKRVHFTIHPLQRTRRGEILAVAPLLGYRWIKSSSGHQEHRPVIVTTVRLGDREWPIEVTLTNRDVMGFRMLLGRQAIEHHFLIDAAHSFLGNLR